MADLLQDLTKKSEIGDAVWTSNNKMLFNILITCIFVAEIQFSTLLGLKKFQVLCYCNTSCVLQSAKQFFYLFCSVENFQNDSIL